MLCQYPLADLHYLNQQNYTWPSESCNGFSHLWPGVFHIPLRKRNSQPRGLKKRTNKQLTLAPSARGRSLWHFLCIVWSNASVYSSENSHKATSNADLSSPVGQPGICGSTGVCSRLSDFWLLPASFCSLLLTVTFSALLSSLSTVYFSFPLSIVSFSWLTPPADCPLLLPSAHCSLETSFPRSSGLVGDLAHRPFVWVSF